MTDAKQSLPVNLFSSQSSVANSSASASRNIDGSAENGRMFSRELSRATERSTSADNSEPSGRRDGEASRANEKPQRPDATNASRHEAHKRTKSEHAAANASTRTRSADKAQSKETKSDQGADVRAAESSSGAENNAGSTPLNNTDAKNSSGTPLATSIISDLALAGKNPSDTIGDQHTSQTLSHAPGLASPIAQNTSGENEGSDALDSTSRPGTVSHSALDGKLAGTAADAKTANREPLTLAQLANGKLSSVNAESLPKQMTPDQSRAGQLGSGKNEASVVALSIVAGQSADKNLHKAAAKTSDKLIGVRSAEISSSGLLSTNGKSVEKLTVDVGIKKAAMEEAAQLASDAQHRLMSQKLEQQNGQTNLLEARQLAQQQAQNLSMVSAVNATASLEPSGQSPDNMFLSTASGIVTAPVLQRADAGSPNIINTPINLPILQSDADKAMAGNIRWMVNEGVKSAVVNITPHGMGPISVTVGIDKEQMNVAIVALQGSTREALDTMLPRLREQLVSQGHTNVNVDISDGRSDQSERGYAERYSGDQGDTSRDARAQSSEKASAGLGERESANENAQNVAEQGVLELQRGGQALSAFDVYV